VDSSRIVQVEEDILSENNHYAAHNREQFAEHKILALNIVSSPGSGKTSLLTHTLTAKHDKTAVIEGDQFTDRDAERLRKTGAPVIQINTGSGCHLDAHMVGHALDDLNLESGELDGGVVYIENVGNLVCPASFDLGEAAKVVLLSVTEGEDKPVKYSHMFAASKLMLITKMDLLPYVPFDVEQCIAFAREVNPTIQVIKLSVRNNEGVQDWFDWIDAMKIA
jgi:hydrogenase nickel incorporation protein HypB